jgi:hypothetical protein
LSLNAGTLIPRAVAVDLLVDVIQELEPLLFRSDVFALEIRHDVEAFPKGLLDGVFVVLYSRHGWQVNVSRFLHRPLSDFGEACVLGVADLPVVVF